MLWLTREEYINNKLKIRHWKVTDSTTETKDIYMYDEKGLLIKILHYDVWQGNSKLESFIEYKYEYYKKKAVANKR